MTATIPIPEAPETLDAQLDWLAAGKRQSVLTFYASWPALT